ncbi:quinone-dependent dihydroorotate dehydrogenase [Intrasporangium calvum]|uniref:Dihydroorotate dehydrogenase (quinone) n=1 Tax=Intrasporangium calvum TaxID=53358 RepID=A0ABT5GIY5_9MICO|nr:quinone-dependent dihydroorotate dehydrogenase [Intrasporangium calvum]MDC5698049.1 quinone-dependent dihydroorotate dehydrogenase [Intrasporangium calvum]
MIYERVVRPALFRIRGGDAETAHHTTMAALSRLTHVPPALAALRRWNGADDPTTVFGVRFPSRVGLAAGMDKDGVALPAWPALGFGFVEVGTVTRHAQPGNPRPRLFRLRESGAIINRMGFNNEGADALAARLAALGPLGVPLGISIGKSKVTPVEEAVGDYVHSMRALRGFADYVAINVSSPNTPGLRGLQDRAMLDELVAALQAEAEGTPLLVKIAPDLTDDAIGEVLQVCADHGLAGVIATNTTIARDGVAASDLAVAQSETGGLSGRPLTARAREVVALIHREAPDLPVIGVGGISTVDDAKRMLDAGAALLQLYTGFIFGGPPLVRVINRAINRGLSG